MKPDLTPVQARGGVISGRIVTLLVASLVGIMVALCAVWLLHS